MLYFFSLWESSCFSLGIKKASLISSVIYFLYSFLSFLLRYFLLFDSDMSLLFEFVISICIGYTKQYKKSWILNLTVVDEHDQTPSRPGISLHLEH